MAKNDYKRYYWLRLKKDFFQQHQIKVLKSLPNGRLYALIYLELLAESTSHEGELRYSQMLPYDIITLSAVIDEDKDNVEKAIETLINLELIEILDDGTIYMREIQKLIGSETGSAERKREYRERLETNEEVRKIEEGTMSPNCPQEYRDKSIDIRDNNKTLNKTKTLNNFKDYIEVRSNATNRKQFVAEDGVEAFITIPLLCNKTYIVTLEEVENYKKLFPAIDVEQEIRNAVAWIEANPTNRKKNGKRFLTNWLIREQSRAPAKKNKSGVTYLDTE